MTTEAIKKLIEEHYDKITVAVVENIDWENEEFGIEYGDESTILGADIRGYFECEYDEDGNCERTDRFKIEVCECSIYNSEIEDWEKVPEELNEEFKARFWKDMHRVEYLQ